MRNSTRNSERVARRVIILARVLTQILKSLLEGEEIDRSKVLQEMFRYMKREYLEEALKWEPELLVEKILYNHLHLKHPKLENMWRVILRLVWEDIEREITSVRRVKKILVKADKRNEELLSKPENISWLNRFVKKLYNELYSFTWEV